MSYRFLLTSFMNVVTLFITLCTVGHDCCGGITHTEIAHRAASFFQHHSDGTDYRQLIDQHQDAFQAGNPFPDTFYDSICLQGKYHDVSEDTHWSEFINATVNYIRTKYPKPWSPETEKLVVFLLGFVSHDVADVSWHSLGIDQGFLQTMGKVNFYGSFEDAHDVGDIGGDIAALFEFNMDYIHSLTEWYIPVQDLIEIFQDFYAKKVITPTILEECAALMFLARFGERIAVGELYPLYSKKSPFLMEQYQSYFLGGVDDMAVWSQNIWHNTIHMIDHGMHDCDVPHNPLYIRCQNSSLALKDYERHPRRTHLYSRLQLGGLTLDDVIMKRTPKGVYLSPAKSLQDKLLNLEELKRNGGNVEAGDLTKPDATYSVKTPYTHLGWKIVTADINNDGFLDLLIGAPGYSVNNNYQQGRVYIVYGKVTGLPLLDKDLNEQADVILEGIKYNGRFGSAILVMDLNVDGLNDLIVSAPSVNSESLMYTGEVYTFYGSNSGQLSKNPNITITCETKYCNLGHSLTSGDLNQDGFDDLVVGSPFAPMDGGNQRGMVNVLFSNTDLTGKHVLSIRNMNWTYGGRQDYEWFGYDVSVSVASPKSITKYTWLSVSSPTYRICTFKNCSYSKNDTQSVGRLQIFNFSSQYNPTSPFRTMTGVKSFGKLGSAMATGNPYKEEDVLVLSANSLNVPGNLIEIPTTFSQAGKVFLYNVSSIMNVPPPTPFATFSGDRSYARFGNKIVIHDITGDDIDDLLIGSSFRTDDITEELYGGEEGRVYMFEGGLSPPSGDVTGKCGLFGIIIPCPGKKASAEYGTNEKGSRFGSDIALLKHIKGVDLIVSAVHSSHGARLSGAVHVFKIK